MKLGIFTVIILLIKAIWSDELFKERAIYSLFGIKVVVCLEIGGYENNLKLFYQVSEIHCVIPVYDIL